MFVRPLAKRPASKPITEPTRLGSKPNNDPVYEPISSKSTRGASKTSINCWQLICEPSRRWQRVAAWLLVTSSTQPSHIHELIPDHSKALNDCLWPSPWHHCAPLGRGTARSAVRALTSACPYVAAFRGSRRTRRGLWAMCFQSLPDVLLF